jgi:phosphoribosylaminoimidazole (AIR) synthetase
MKQTAVEKFIQQLEEQGQSWENVSVGRIQISIKVEDYFNLIKQAKQMEKQQIIDAFKYGVGVVSFGTSTTSELYYNETFKKK